MSHIDFEVSVTHLLKELREHLRNPQCHVHDVDVTNNTSVESL